MKRNILLRGEQYENQDIRLHASVLLNLLSAIQSRLVSASDMVGTGNYCRAYACSNYHLSYSSKQRPVLRKFNCFNVKVTFMGGVK